MKIRVMGRSGDLMVGEVTHETSREELKWIEDQWREMSRRGYSAFGTKSGQRLKSFEPDLGEDVIFVAQLVGG